MIMTRTRRFRTLTLGPVVAATCGLLLLAGCSSASGTASGSPSNAAQNGGGQNEGGQNGGGQSDPGRVSGEIAAVDGKTLQIQDGESQTAVTYTSKTTFTAQVAGSVSDISKGDCVMVFSSSTDEKATEVTATTVSASDAVDGKCSSGFGGGGGAGGGGNRPSGQPSGMPSGQPSGMPSGGPSGGPSGMPNGGGRPQSGKVTAVDGDTLTVAVATQGSDDTTDLTVKTTSKTSVTVTEESKASAAKVGVCATVNGKADDTGAVKASTISLRKAGDDGCSMRRGNR